MGSSTATVPVTLRTVEERMGVKNRVASFAVPLGATINMDGTAIMQGVATVFIAQAFQLDLSMTDYLLVIMTAMLASIGTAGAGAATGWPAAGRYRPDHWCRPYSRYDAHRG